MTGTSISQRVFSLELELEQLRRSVAKLEITNDGLKFKLEQALRQLAALINLVSQNTKYKDFLTEQLGRSDQFSEINEPKPTVAPRSD